MFLDPRLEGLISGEIRLFEREKYTVFGKLVNW